MGIELARPETAEHDPQEVVAADARLRDLLDKVATPDPLEPAAGPGPAPARAPAAALAGVAMRTATPVAVRGRTVRLRCRGMDAEISAELAPGVSPELVQLAVTNADAVVLECAEGELPLVVGVLQARVPRELVLRARKICLEGDEELLLRAGRGALRIRQDGDIELVGSRIAAASRGLFRLVGRMLRLN